ncbi:MAG: hypothetical protein IJW19_08045 [Clostridia bacterium]|nr:hypothetical protein [Clostridia bacterium]
MKKFIRAISMLLLFAFMLSMTGCDKFSNGDGAERYDNELQSSTGCWRLLGDEDTYFVLDGSKGVMSFRYIQDGVTKYSGTYKVIYSGTGKDISTPLTFLLTRNDKSKEDWLSCYTECFKEDFTQFTIMREEEDLGNIDGSVYTHIYRISELPYKMGTYILEGNEYKGEHDYYSNANNHIIPEGTYTLSTGESFTFVCTKPSFSELFLYRNGDTVVEGTFTMAEDMKTVYLYIEHDPYSKVTNADKNKYDTTFDINYPPDFYLRGDFSNPDKIVINGLYHHTYSPTKIKDSTWVFGTYVKQ